MKKIFSLFLAIVMVVVCFVPIADAAETEEVYEKVPMVYVRGNGWWLYDENGQVVKTGFDVLSDENTQSMLTKEALVDTAINVLIPFLKDGMLCDEWEAYGDALYEELAPLWDYCSLDGDGNTKNGIVADPGQMNYYENVRAYQDMGADGYFYATDYYFVYDWRLSPYDSVDRLHTFIQKIMQTTNCDQVCISARCMGGSLLNAYLERYGHLGHVKKVFYSDVLSGGCSFVSDTFSGKIKLDAKVMQTFLKQLEYFGDSGMGTGIVLSELASDFISRTMDLLTQTGVLDTFLGGVEYLYDKLYQEFIPAVVLATGIATYPNYWVSVYEEDMDTALNLVFGEEGSEKRKENAGLIEKIQYYREHISSDLPAFFEKISDEYGIEVGVLARYGFMSVPYTEHGAELSDNLVGVQDASFGATTSNIFTTLSDSYIQNRINEGKEDYISLDKMIDASTCAFPETTWFLKNSPHEPELPFEYLATYFFQYSNVTASSNNRNISRFLVYDASNTANGEMVNMSTDNMANLDYLNTAEQEPTIKTKFEALCKWIETLFEFIVKLFKGEIKFG